MLSSNKLASAFADVVIACSLFLVLKTLIRILINAFWPPKIKKLRAIDKSGKIVELDLQNEKDIKKVIEFYEIILEQ